MALRTSTGDFSDFDGFSSQPKEILGFSWLVWLCAVLLLNIMFMNFVIAAMTESYFKNKQRQISLIYLSRAQLIREREVFMTEVDF